MMASTRIKHIQRVLSAGYRNLNRDPAAFAINPHSKHMVQTLHEELKELETLDEQPAELKQIRSQVDKLATALSDSEIQRGILALAAQAVGSEFDEESSGDDDDYQVSSEQARGELYDSRQGKRAQEAIPHLSFDDNDEMKELSSLTERIKESSLALQREIHQGAALANAADSQMDDLVQGVHKANAISTKLAAAGSWFATLKSFGLVILVLFVSVFCAAIIRFLPAS